MLFRTDFPGTNVTYSLAGLRNLAHIQIHDFSLPAVQIEVVLIETRLRFMACAHKTFE